MRTNMKTTTRITDEHISLRGSEAFLKLKTRLKKATADDDEINMKTMTRITDEHISLRRDKSFLGFRDGVCVATCLL